MNSTTKALHILELFSETDGGLTLGDITQLTGINESTVSHIVSTLVVNGFLSQPVKRGKYYLGENFLNIAGALKFDGGNKLSNPYLVELSRLVNGSIVLEVWHRYGMDAEMEQVGTKFANNQEWVQRVGISIKDISFEIKNGEGYPIGIIFPIDLTIRPTVDRLNKLMSSVKVCALKISGALAEKSDEMKGEFFPDKNKSSTGTPGWDLKEKINTITDFGKRLKPVNSITRTLHILELFSENDGRLTLGGIAKSVGLAKSTVSRIVSTLAINGFLVQLKKRGTYYLGVRFLDIGGTIKHNSKDSLIISYLLELSRRVDMPVYLEVMNKRSGWTEKNVDFNQEAPNVIEWIIKHPSSCVGKILLAYLKNTDLSKYFRYTYLIKSQPKMKSDIDRFKAELSVIRQKQVAYGSEDVIFDANEIATVIKNNEGLIIGILSTIGDSNRLTNTKLKDIIPIVRTYKLMISKALIA